jgi:hypothetical protein
MKSYADVESKVLAWGIARGIVQNAKPRRQALESLDGVIDLLYAINKDSTVDVRDALGDVWVTLVMCAATMDINLLECFYEAYDQIKDRKGYLTPEGVFVKEPTSAN